MDKNDRIQSLESIFGNVNSWLNHAEAKNGALLALNIAVICGILSLEETIQIWNTTLIVVLLISTVIAMCSFWPNLQTDGSLGTNHSGANRTAQRNSNVSPTGNLLFYGEIAKMQSAEQYLEKLFDTYYDSDIRLASQIEQHYAEEIWVNSKITKKKYDKFRWALMLDLLACVLSLVFLILA